MLRQPINSTFSAAHTYVSNAGDRKATTGTNFNNTSGNPSNTNASYSVNAILTSRRPAKAPTGPQLLRLPMSTSDIILGDQPRAVEHGGTRKRSKRLRSLDVVRGLNVMLMWLVDNIGGSFPSWVGHSPWNTVHLADFVMPFFLVMVGISMAFSMKKYNGPGATWKVLSRTLKLVVLGLMQSSAFIEPGKAGVDVQTMRISGILQRIAFAYCIVALIMLYVPVWTKFGFRMPYVGSMGDVDTHCAQRAQLFSHYACHWFVASIFVGVNVCIMLFMSVPTFTFTTKDGKNYTQTCNIHGDLTPACSAARLVDSKLLGWRHIDAFSPEYTRSHWCSACSPFGDMRSCPHREDPNDATSKSITPAWCYAPMEMEGVVSSLPTVLTTWLGVHFGLVLIHNATHAERLRHLTAVSLVCAVLGWVINIGWKMNKQIWSPSYLFFMTGSCGGVLVAFYTLCDIQPQGHKLPAVLSLARYIRHSGRLQAPYQSDTMDELDQLLRQIPHGDSMWVAGDMNVRIRIKNAPFTGRWGTQSKSQNTHGDRLLQTMQEHSLCSMYC